MMKNTALVLLTGILIALSLPPFRTGFLAYGALIPLFLLIDNKKGFELFRWSYLTGFFVFLFTLFWLWNVTKPGFLAILMVLPLSFVIYAYLHSFLLRAFGNLGYVFLPFLWTAIEYLESFGELAFPWVYLGYTQTYYLPLVQYAEYTGVYGISFWVVALNVLFYLMWLNRSRRRKLIVLAIFTSAMFLLPVAHGLAALKRVYKSDSVTVAIIQGNIDPYEKLEPALVGRNVDIYLQKTREMMALEPDLVVWPETATGTWLRYERQYRNRIHYLVDSTRIPLLTGSIDYQFTNDADYEYYNSAFLFEPNTSRIQDYRKMQLVPFSERIPYSNLAPVGVFYKLLYDLAVGVGNFTKGKEYKLLSFLSKEDYKKPSFERERVTKRSIAVPICYESVFPNLVRKLVAQGADFLAIITNDAWFGKTTAPYQHAQFATLRAIENRISIVRSANTGVSAFIDPYGRLTQATPIFKLATRIGKLGLRSVTTFYTKHGNVFANFVSFVLLASLIVGLFVKPNLQKN